MVAELSALQQIISALTGLDGLPALVVEALVTALYTCEILPDDVAIQVDTGSSRGFSNLPRD